MFTIGIFSTHIPYIALVAFYAYFLLFGMEKASKGEIVAENATSSLYEVQVADHFDAKNTCCFYYQTTDSFAAQEKFEEFIFKRKISRKALTDNLYYRFHFIPGTSNRPPPTLC
ncbi:hypothetical protein SAMN05444280_10872 [Tangfeifania diversioriginum]|uniref:Uncharacterized protein n=1 Tax=Tangfeifania diversioriginum TaxID=1168035 RepID=A0A1M6F8Q2_9BACT|nr:hypothetical protein [Tangfeifania diversioriginum]SHI94036.1 hypothetical protein SAMN05444280_10872 [Tangfeifania diversioriginum]